MSLSLGAIGLPEIVAGLIVLALNAYVLTGGADYGGGVWDLLASGPRRAQQRELIAHSIAPIWEANHVWLIVAVVLLFTGFPAAFSMIAIVLHIPLTLLLIGVVLRGSAFIFRSYGSGGRGAQRAWGMTFAIASTIAPVILGVIIGAVSSGQVAAASARVGKASFADVFIQPWLAPFPIAVGVFALALFAFLAAVYLTVETTDDDLREDFRRRALAMVPAVFVTAAVALGLSMSGAPRVAGGVVGSPWSLALHPVTAILAITVIIALWRRRYALARVAVAGQVSCILWGWALSQHPFIVPNTLTIREAAAPRITLELMLVGMVIGSAVLIPSLRYLFKTFAGRASEAV